MSTTIISKAHTGSWISCLRGKVAEHTISIVEFEIEAVHFALAFASAKINHGLVLMVPIFWNNFRFVN